jgi:hypothetical protein
MSLIIHCLNVGHGDCTFIELPSGRLMMVDINNSTSLPDDDVVALAASKGVSPFEFKRYGSLATDRSWEEYYESLLVDPYEYYQEHFAGRSIFRYVQTHPDMDHMGGLRRFFWQARVPLENFWDVDHDKSMEETDFEFSPYSYLDWAVYTLLRGGVGPDGTSHKVIKNVRGDEGQFWSDDNIQVLSPTADLIADCNRRDCYNDCSYVLKISYSGRSIILSGDAEGPAWASMVASPAASDLL